MSLGSHLQQTIGGLHYPPQANEYPNINKRYGREVTAKNINKSAITIPEEVFFFSSKNQQDSKLLPLTPRTSPGPLSTVAQKKPNPSSTSLLAFKPHLLLASSASHRNISSVPLAAPAPLSPLGCSRTAHPSSSLAASLLLLPEKRLLTIMSSGSGRKVGKGKEKINQNKKSLPLGGGLQYVFKKIDTIFF